MIALSVATIVGTLRTALVWEKYFSEIVLFFSCYRCSTNTKVMLYGSTVWLIIEYEMKI